MATILGFRTKTRHVLAQQWGMLTCLELEDLAVNYACIIFSDGLTFQTGYHTPVNLKRVGDGSGGFWRLQSEAFGSN